VSKKKKRNKTNGKGKKERKKIKKIWYQIVSVFKNDSKLLITCARLGGMLSMAVVAKLIWIVSKDEQKK
jgi:hypothetical protein